MPTHRLRVRFISICTTNVPIPLHVAKMRDVYAQYGIHVVEVSGMSLMLSQQEAARFATVDGQCRWNISGGEYREIQELSNTTFSTDIAVYYVNRLAGGVVGCGGHMPNRPACIVAANGTQWTTAHEVGHVLLTSRFRPVHETSISNLMYRSTAAITTPRPVLTTAQVDQIKRSPCCHPI